MKTISQISSLAFVMATMVLTSAQSQENSNKNPIFPIPNGVTYLTGDSWDQGGTVVRLFGVQSCIRGTNLKTANGETDCGDISMAFLANFMKTSPTKCQGIIQTDNPPQYHVICKSTVGTEEVDLGTALILKGFAFAMNDASGIPVNIQYYIAEQEAKTKKAGLWNFDKFPHPNLIIKAAVKEIQNEQ